MITLRPYQEQAICQARCAIRDGKKRFVLQLPTGAGKTVIAVKIIESALAKGRKVAFIVDRLALVSQTVGQLDRVGIECGVIQGNHERSGNTHLPVQVASIQTLKNREHWDCDVAIIDECHVLHKAHLDLMERSPKTIFIGLSATPWAKGMGKHFQALLQPVTIQELIEGGHLVNADIYAPKTVSMRGVRMSAGDYNGADLEKVSQQKILNGDLIKEWQASANDKQTLVMATNVRHSVELADRFKSEGITAAQMDAQTPIDVREGIIQAFKRNKIQVLTSVGVLTTGFDAPNAECLIIARPTASEMLHVQMMGRVLRPADGKGRALIIDHTGNCKRFGGPCEPRPTDLDYGEAKPKSNAAPKAIECKKCSYVMSVGDWICPACGHERIKSPEEQHAEMERLLTDPTTVEYQTKFLGGLKAIQQERGYKPGWVAMNFKEHVGRFPSKSLQANAVAEHWDTSDRFIQRKHRDYRKRMNAEQKQEML